MNDKLRTEAKNDFEKDSCQTNEYINLWKNNGEPKKT